jgi:hypothetical protein
MAHTTQRPLDTFAAIRTSITETIPPTGDQEEDEERTTDMAIVVACLADQRHARADHAVMAEEQRAPRVPMIPTACPIPTGRAVPIRPMA